MKKQTSIALLIIGAVAGLSGCASVQEKNHPAFQQTEIQCDVSGLHALASDVPDYSGALRGFGDDTARRSVLIE